MNGLLLLKLTLVPVLVALITLAGRRWGPGVAGWLVAFPVVSAPILFFVSIDQGREFAATAGAATMLAVLAILGFGIAYAWSATRFSWPLSVVIGFACYALVLALLDHWMPTLTVTAMVIAASLLLAPRLYPTPGDAPPLNHAVISNDIGYRMFIAAVMVFIVTHFSSRLGAHLSGLLALFPAIGSVITVFSHRDLGAPFAIRLLRSMVLGYYAFATFCFVLALTLPGMSIGAAFALALGSAVGVQVVTRPRRGTSLSP